MMTLIKRLTRKLFTKPFTEPVLYNHWEDVPMERWRWPNFTPQELASPTLVNGKRGPKGPVLIDPRALDMLQELRDKWGKPLVLNSAYRSPEYNKFIKGAERSKHMQGIAFDSPKTKEEMEDYVKLALSIGFNGIGRYNTFVHVDARQTGIHVVWDRRT